MRKYKNIETYGSIGVGSLVLFLATLLVVSITASVLIQSSTSLESQGLKTGKETTEDVAQAVGVSGVIGYCVANTAITKLVIKVEARPGTNGIDLSTAFVKISDSHNSYMLDYGNVLNHLEDIGGSIFQFSGVWAGSSATKYNIIVVQDEDGSCTQNTPIINQGDAVLLTISASSIFNDVGGFLPRTDVFGYIMIEEGVPGVFLFRTPPAYRNAIINLFP
jgi:flagellin FlaB